MIIQKARLVPMDKFIKVDRNDNHKYLNKLNGDDWLLLAAGNKIDGFNAMIFAWVGWSNIWQKDCTFFFIRPSRYTHGFLQRNEYFSFSYFDEKYKKALSLIGSKSGSRGDKITESGLHTVWVDNVPAFIESNLIIRCRKFFWIDFTPENIPSDIMERYYPKKNDYHRFYAGEIIDLFVPGIFDS
jgi:flavin reductase (DIM6/NTAB) family NADH-FMN oxidoreductase RutF